MTHFGRHRLAFGLACCMVAAVCGLGARAQVYDAINPSIDNVREEQRRQPGCPEVVLDRRGRVTDALLLIESIHGGH